MKHKHTLTKSKTGLIVIDVQEKFAPAIPGFDDLVTNATRLVLTFEMFDLPIVVTEQYPEGLGSTVDKIRSQFTMLEVVEKIELAATENRQFMEKVNKLGLDTFVVCGIETHVCVNQTVLGLLARGKNVHVVADAVGSRKEIDRTTGLRKMENAGAIITTAETVMFELAERAGTESFKNIQIMIKGQKPKLPAQAAKPAKKTEQPKEAEEKKTPATKQETVIAKSDKEPVASKLSDSKPTGKVAEPVAAPAAAEDSDAVDIVDLKLAAEAKKIHEKQVLSAKGSEAIDEKPAQEKGPKETIFTASDSDATEAVDIDDMLASIDKKVDSHEPIGAVPADIDKDIADLEDMMKTDGNDKK